MFFTILLLPKTQYHVAGTEETKKCRLQLNLFSYNQAGYTLIQTFEEMLPSHENIETSD